MLLTAYYGWPRKFENLVTGHIAKTQYLHESGGWYLVVDDYVGVETRVLLLTSLTAQT